MTGRQPADEAYLLGLRLRGRRVVVIGAGAVAARRVPRLLAAGADVVLVSPEATPAIEDLAAAGRVDWRKREYRNGDCDGAWLVCACAGPAEVNARVAEEAEKNRIWCVRADDASESTAWTPAAGAADDIKVGVLTGDPRRSAAIRDAITTGLQSGAITARHYRRRASGVALVGGGPGDPGLITVRGRQLLAEADVVVTDRLAPRELLAELPPDVTVIDAGKVPYKRAMSQDEINDALVTNAQQGRFVVRLKGGDPFVFGRGGEEMLACLRAGVPATVVPGVSSAVGVPTAAGVPVTHRGTAQDFHVISVHVPPGDERSTVDWAALAKTDGTLVLMMALERLGDVARELIRHGRPGNYPISVIADGTMPTQRTIYSTLDQVERQVAQEEIRPPAVVVIGGVVTIATELAGLARRLAGDGQAAARRLRPGGISSLVSPLAEENQRAQKQAGRMEGKGETAEQSLSPGITWRASEPGHDHQPDQPQQAHQLDQSQPAQQADLSNQARDTDIVNSMAAPDDEKGENPVPGGELVPQGGSQPGPAGHQPGAAGSWHEPRVRVDARLLEATLLNLRKRIAGIPLVFDLQGAAEVEAERAKLLSQIDDYLLPRVRQSAAPILVALVGSTGAGKSTLVNSIVGTQVSLTGIRRPTTNSPVLACHPDDIGWFAENMFLPTLPRVRQEGLARPGRDGLLVLATSEGMTKGVALLDTPDIDSVVRAHYDFAYQFLDASDLWLFMTSASRYADAPVWEILQHARERGAALGVILSRVPPAHRPELVAHFDAMLTANGIVPGKRFVIPETGILDGMLPVDVLQPVKEWLTETAQHSDRRVAVLTQTMAGVLDTFKLRVPRLAAHVDAQVSLRTRLRYEAEAAYGTALKEFDQSTRSARLLRGEVLARWQDYADSGELGAALRGKRVAHGGKRARKGTGVSRPAALDTALRAALQALVVSVADRAAEQVTRTWRADPAATVLLAAAEASTTRGEYARREFESAFGTGAAGAAGTGGTGPGTGAGAGAGDDEPARPPSLDRSSPDLPLRVSRAVSAWQDHLMRLIQGETTSQRATGASRASEPLSLVTLVAMLGEPAIATGRRTGPVPAETDESGEIATVPRELLMSAIGAAGASELVGQVRRDLTERVRLLLDEELLRFLEVLDDAGQVDPVAAVRLYQAEYSLEAVR